MKPISAQCKSDVISALNQGLSFRTVARRLSVGYVTVYRIAQESNIGVALCKTGRPCKISEHLKRLVVRTITTGRVDTAVDIQRLLAADYNIKLTSQKVRNMLKVCGLKASHKVKKPLLTKRHRELRLQFAKKYRHWTVDNWKRIVFSDETKVNRIGSDGRKWVWREAGSSLKNNNVLPTVKHGGGSIIIWDCLTAKGIGNLVKIDGNLNAHLYVDILRDEFLGTLDWYSLDKAEIVLQHDNDSKHTAKLTTEWLENESI